MVTVLWVGALVAVVYVLGWWRGYVSYKGARELDREAVAELVAAAEEVGASAMPFGPMPTMDGLVDFKVATVASPSLDRLYSALDRVKPLALG